MRATTFYTAVLTASSLTWSAHAGCSLPNACLPERAKPSYDWDTGAKYTGGQLPNCHCPPKEICTEKNEYTPSDEPCKDQRLMSKGTNKDREKAPPGSYLEIKRAAVRNCVVGTGKLPMSPLLSYNCCKLCPAGSVPVMPWMQRIPDDELSQKRKAWNKDNSREGYAQTKHYEDLVVPGAKVATNAQVKLSHGIPTFVVIGSGSGQVKNDWTWTEKQAYRSRNATNTGGIDLCQPSTINPDYNSHHADDPYKRLHNGCNPYFSREYLNWAYLLKNTVEGETGPASFDWYDEAQLNSEQLVGEGGPAPGQSKQYEYQCVKPVQVLEFRLVEPVTPPCATGDPSCTPVPPCPPGDPSCTPVPPCTPGDPSCPSSSSSGSYGGGSDGGGGYTGSYDSDGDRVTDSWGSNGDEAPGGSSSKDPPGDNLGGTSTSSSSTSGTGSKVFCTYFYYERGMLDKRDYIGDIRYNLATFSDADRAGYHFWAVPLIEYCRNHKGGIVEKIMWQVTEGWAIESAYRYGLRKKGSIRGKIVFKTVYPVCWLLGKFVGKQDYQRLWRNSDWFKNNEQVI